MTPRPSIWPVRRSIVSALIAACVVLALTPGFARADLGFGVPVPFDPSPVPATGSQTQVAAAGPDSVALFVWSDTRAGDARIFGARVRADGTVIDRGGIEISTGPGSHIEPTVSWNGSNWLVVWSEVVDPASAVELRGMRIAPDGALIDPSPIEITNESGATERRPALTWTGAKHILVWEQDAIVISPATKIVGLTVDADGTVNGPVTVLGDLVDEFSPAIAALGSTALVAYELAGDIKAVRVAISAGPSPLVKLDAQNLLIAGGSNSQHAAAVAASATNNEWFVAWEDGAATGGNRNLFARRVAANGNLPGPASIDVATESGDDADVALIANDTAWLATWTRPGEGQFLRKIPANGSPAGSRIDVGTGTGFVGNGAFGGDPAAPVVAWSQPGEAPGQDLFGRTVAANLDLGDRFPLATQTPNQTEPALAFSGARWMVAWVDDRFGPTAGQIRVAFSDSAALAPPIALPIAFAAPRPGLDQSDPAATYDGVNFSLFWSEERGGFRRIVGARFTAGGSFIDTFTVSSGAWNESEPAAATRDESGEIILCWTDDRAGANDRDLWQATVLDGAVVVAEGAVIQDATSRDERPSLAPTKFGEAFMVYQRVVGVAQSEIRFATLSRDPFVHFANPLRVEAGARFEDPKIAFNGEDFAITYQQLQDNDGPILHIPFAQYYSSIFGDFTPQQLGPGSYAPARPVVGSAGYSFVSMWGSLVSGSTDVYLRTLYPSFAFLGEGPLPLVSDPAPDVAAAAEHGLSDRVGLMFLRAQSDAEWNGTRLFSGEAQDTIAGKVVINEFLVNPPSGRSEFFELFNVSGRTFRLNGWKFVVNGLPEEVQVCSSKSPQPLPGPGESALAPGDRTLGSLCGDFFDGEFHPDSTFEDLPFTAEGYLPNRSARLQLFSPQGVLVDQVAYGDSGGATVSGAIPDSTAPRRPPIGLDGASAMGFPNPPRTLALGDSIPVSTSRIPNGIDTDNDGEDFNLTTNNTPGDPNVGTAAAPGTALFFTRVYAKGPPGLDAVEIYNPSSTVTFDFTNWYLGDGEALERIGVANTAFGRLLPGQKQILRQGERGAFTFGLDYDDVLALYDDQLAKVEQIAWNRADLAFPDMCQTRVPETGGLHTGYSWISSGGQQDFTSGEVRYTTCVINAPQIGVEPGPASFSLTFAGALPNPARAGQNPVLVFTIPGAPGSGGALPVRIRVYDVAGKLVATPLDAFEEAGEHRVSLAGALRAAGVYYAELDVAGQKLRKSVVVLP